MNTSNFLLDAITVLFRRKYLVVGLFATIVIGIGALFAITPTEYESTMKVLVASRSRSPADGSSPMFGANSESELFTSTDVLRRVVTETRLDLAEVSWASDSAQRRKVMTEKAIARLRQSLRVIPVERSYVIRVAYRGRTPQLAAAVLWKLRDAVLEVHRGAQSSEAEPGPVGRGPVSPNTAPSMEVSSSLAELGSNQTLALLERPEEPTLRASPSLRLHILLGFFTATLISVAGAFVAEWLSNTVHSAAELEAVAGLPVLGTLPKRSAPDA